MKKTPIPIISLADVRANVLVGLIAARDKSDLQMVQLLVSISEYLKDAECWHYVKDQCIAIPELGTPADIQAFVDDHMRRNGK